jgi:LysM repeat protein
LDASEKIERDPAVGLTIYYAQRGESVWEIGKRYHVPVQAIMGDNGLDADTLEGKTALLIPIV